MLISKPLTAAVLGVLVGLGGSSVAFAKAHDSGVADFSRTDPSILNRGGVAGRDVPGVGFSREGEFLGVAAELNADMVYTYGGYASELRGGNRVVPVLRDEPVK